MGAVSPAPATAEHPHLVVVDALQLVELLSGNHERGQVGGVDGEEHDGEQRPHGRHEPETAHSRGRRHDLGRNSRQWKEYSGDMSQWTACGAK